MKFSIVIPCRDDQLGLDRAVNSVLTQTVRDVEVVVVDDGSAPRLTVVDDARVKLLRRDVAGGPAVARNLGLEAARGEIIGWCDSDDYFAPGRLALAERLHDDADIVVVGQGHAASPAASSPVRLTLDEAIDRTSPHLGATTIRRERCLPLDDRYLACEDIEWWIRTIEQGASFRSHATVGYLVGSDDRVRVLNSSTARLDFSYAVLEQHADFFERHRKASAFRWLRIAVMERREGNLALARQALVASMKAERTALAAKESARLARDVACARRPGPPIATRPLPPLSSLRARQLEPLVRGTAESRQWYPSNLLNVISSLSSRFPRSLRGRLRRVATSLHRSEMVNARTVRGLLPLTASEVRLLSPYSDEPLEMAMLARFLQPGMTAVDVGANRGTYSLMFSARVGERGSVLAVEPDARMLARLQSLRSLNGLQDVLTIVAGAVAAASGERVLSLETEPALNHLLPESGFLSSSRTATVKALTYVDLISRYSLDGVDLLKVDVEGAEPEVLASVLACHDRDLQPTVIMFEFVPAHWQRLGQHALAPTAAALGVHYHLFAIDYGSGSLLPFGDSGLPAWGGRNVLAIHRTNSHDALRRIGLGPFRPIEVDESTVFHFPSAATGVADSPP